MLELRAVQKRYGDLVAVRDASFEIGRGERFGLLGPNGAGKTTTISLMTGTQDADAGEVRLEGVTMNTRALAAKRKVGYVPQEIALYEDLDGIGNLRFFGALYGLMGKEMETARDRALEVTGLRDRASDPVRTYSGGMKRRLNIAAALLHNPELLILDEPTVGVDPQSRNAIFDALLALSSTGMTLVYTTHYMEEVERMCQRIAVMDHGEVIACGSQSDLHKLLPRTDTVTIELAEPILLPGINATMKDRTLTLELANLTQDLPDVLLAIRDAGGKVLAIRTSTPSLEEVFLHLTGRTLRD